MLHKLKVALVQFNILWEQPELNINKLNGMISTAKGADLIVLPEMFSTGFSMNTKTFSEEMSGPTVAAMKVWAKETNAVVCGSVMIKENEQAFNRFCWVEPNGNIAWYNKAHLFRMGDEHSNFVKGKAQQLFNIKHAVLSAFVCYDIRFPVWLRRTERFNYHVMVVVANWPEKRSMHWKALLKARAIENQCYVIAVNRVGADGNGIMHKGESMIIDPLGEILLFSENDEAVLTAEVDLYKVLEIRNSFPVEIDADPFIITSIAT